MPEEEIQAIRHRQLGAFILYSRCVGNFRVSISHVDSHDSSQTEFESVSSTYTIFWRIITPSVGTVLPRQDQRFNWSRFTTADHFKCLNLKTRYLVHTRDGVQVPFIWDRRKSRQYWLSTVRCQLTMFSGARRTLSSTTAVILDEPFMRCAMSMPY